MTYSEGGARMTLAGNVLTFSGKLECADYGNVDEFLRNVDESLSASRCILDLTQLTFLNSSGIRSLAVFMLGSQKEFDLRINPEITWQQETLPVLTHLKSNAIHIIC